MKFTSTFCNPFQKEIIDLGEIAQEQIVEKFRAIPWSDFLKQMETKEKEEIFYSPSFEIKNVDNQHGLSISAIDEVNGIEYYIFYNRPDKIKPGQHKPDEKGTMATEQTEADAIECITALINNDLDFLDKKIQ